MQKQYQGKRKSKYPSYEVEQKVEYAYEGSSITLIVSGRIDGVYEKSELSGSVHVVEEIKTTRVDPEDIVLSTRSVNEAQLKLYAAMWLANSKESRQIHTELAYIHPDTGAVNQSTHEYTQEDLNSYLISTCKTYVDWLEKIKARVEKRNLQASSQSFPYPKYNEDQQRLARHCYQSLRDSQSILFEAPTGSGKSMTASFPGIKSMGEGQLDRLVFCTARTTGQQAANDAFTTLQEQNDELTITTVSAKERVCLTPGAACRPEECQYAKGHYDRIRDATENLLLRRLVNRNAIETIARNFRVCPFELSLEAAEWSDAIVCDYNYIFDPFVQLSRIHSRLFERVGLLVDEAHRLTDRVREALSCTFDIDQLEQLASMDLSTELKSSVLKLVVDLSNELDAQVGQYGESMVESLRCEIQSRVELLIDTLERPENHVELPEEARDQIFQFYQFQTIWEIKERATHKFAWHLQRTDQVATLELRCLSPDDWIRETIERYHGSVRFSGTLSPGYLYNEEHGVEGPCLQARITPNAERLGVYLVPNLSTFYRDRQHTAAELAALLEKVRLTRDGNWLVAFPSFQYMNLVIEHMPDHDSLLVQEPSLNLDEREEFINLLAIGKQLLGFVVMGGVFTESVDFEHSSLEGVVAVSPGIPPRSLERDRIQELSENGYEIAYRKPAMVRVVQAAGRVFRNEMDRGIVVLIDARFTRREFSRYFPSHWVPQVVNSGELINVINSFEATTN